MPSKTGKFLLIAIFILIPTWDIFAQKINKFYTCTYAKPTKIYNKPDDMGFIDEADHFAENSDEIKHEVFGNGKVRRDFLLEKKSYIDLKSEHKNPTYMKIWIADYGKDRCTVRLYKKDYSYMCGDSCISENKCITIQFADQPTSHYLVEELKYIERFGGYKYTVTIKDTRTNTVVADGESYSFNSTMLFPVSGFGLRKDICYANEPNNLKERVIDAFFNHSTNL